MRRSLLILSVAAMLMTAFVAGTLTAAPGDLTRSNNSGGSDTRIPVIPGTPCWRLASQTFRPEGTPFSACTPTTTTTGAPSTTTPAPTTTSTTTPATSTTTTSPATTTTTPAPPGLAFSETFTNPIDPARFTEAHGQMDQDTTPASSFVGVQSGRLHIDAGEQNYGDSALRINQPFDWAGRTGTATFDVTTPQRDGWTQVAISEDPIPYVSFNEDNTFGPYPREGLMVQFRGGQGCVILKVWHLGALTFNGQGCAFGQTIGDTILNHIELRVSATGVTMRYDAGTITWSTPIQFTRGFVYLDSHNHATEKYAGVPTWNTQWDNVSFDGPALPALNVSTLPLNLPANPTNPRLVMMVNADNQNTGITLSYRLNGGPSHPIPLVKRADQVNAYMIAQAVSASELVAGANTITFTQTNMTRPKFTNVQIVHGGGSSPPPPTTTAAPTTTGAPTTTSAPTTTVPTATTTTVAPPPTTTPTGLLYANAFSAPSDMNRLVLDTHWGTHSSNYTPETFNGDHDMTCGAPATTRTVHEHVNAETVWYCAVADPHFMTGMNTGSYNVISFAPTNPASGTVVFPATANKICWNQNLTDLGGRKWVTVAVISDDRYAANGGDLTYVTPDNAANAGDGTGGAADPVGRIVGGDDFAFVGLKNSVQYFSGAGYQSDFGNLTGVTDKATRYRTCLRDNGNGTVTRTQARPGGSTSTVTLAGRFPTGPRVFIIEDDSYNPDKATEEGAGPAVSNAYTWHWDQIEISAG